MKQILVIQQATPRAVKARSEAPFAQGGVCVQKCFVGEQAG